MFMLDELKELEYLLKVQNDLLEAHIARYGTNVTDADVKRLLIVKSAYVKVTKKIDRTKKKQLEI